MALAVDILFDIEMAKTATPSDWPRWDATDPYLRIDEPTATAAGVRTRQCDFWDSLGL